MSNVNGNVVEEKNVDPSKENLVGNDVFINSFAHLTYSSLYTSDLQKSIKWYYKAFGIQIVSINSDFATMEFAPGRIVFFERDPGSPRQISFITSNIAALRRQLILANVEIDADDESYLRIKDIDGNTIEVRTAEYDWLDISMPSMFVRDLIRCRLDTRDEMHLIAMQITDDIEFHTASTTLLSMCEHHRLNIDGEPFIASRYSDKVEAIFACVAVTQHFVDQLSDGAEYIHIPKHDYAIFPVSYDTIDKLRTFHIRDRAHFMSWSFTKPEESYYILEYYKDDFIHVHMPYYWDRGWQIHDNLMKNKGAEDHDQ